MYPRLLKSCLVTLLAGLAFILPVAAEPNPQVKLQTNQGEIILELYPAKAPKSVANFLQYVDEGFYSNTIFHRVMENFMIQGGGFAPDYTRKETHASIINEASNGLKNDRGTLAMARTPEPHSATAQFFINVTNNDSLNHSAKTPRGWGYCVFGKVIKGMDIVDNIRKLPTGPAGIFQSDVPRTPVIITAVTRLNSTAAAKKKGK
jgi:cyclophilin family peptidyl-prolyl cis-trans isomerase